jgi:tRNA U34 5-methylaminomethyl-2-thiouridine-forming methyltransferase MnmC
VSFYKQVTQDGTSTFFNENFQESYHSNIGAYREALEKHVQACKISDLAINKKQIKILDICFGLAYNSFTAIDEAIKANPDIFVDIVALESDAEIILQIPNCSMPLAFHSMQEQFIAVRDYYKGNNYQINLFIGDARKTIKELDSMIFDAIFFDPFSPKTCPELWQEDFIKDVVRTAKQGAFISTYSSSRIAKENFAKANCTIYEGPKCGRRTGGVLAARV